VLVGLKLEYAEKPVSCGRAGLLPTEVSTAVGAWDRFVGARRKVRGVNAPCPSRIWLLAYNTGVMNRLDREIAWQASG